VAPRICVEVVLLKGLAAAVRVVGVVGVVGGEILRLRGRSTASAVATREAAGGACPRYLRG